MNPKYKDSTMLNIIFSYAVLLLLITNGSANLAKIMKVSQLKKKKKAASQWKFIYCHEKTQVHIVKL